MQQAPGSPFLLKIVSENQFSGKTYLYTIASRVASSRGGGGFMKESESYNSFVLGELDFAVAPDLSDADVTYHAHGMVMNPLKLSVYRYQGRVQQSRLPSPVLQIFNDI